MSMKLNNISDASSRFCVGCGVCMVVCPQEALCYRLNDEGFYEAFVLEDKCVHCGLCRWVCYKFSEDNEGSVRLEEGILWAAQSVREEVKQSCTSGGVAYEIARYCLANGYKVAGVVYDNKMHCAKTVLTDCMEGLERMKGSKYLQADMQEVLRELMEDCALHPEQKYVYFGTPCQINGLKRLLSTRRIGNEVLTVDLFCHGVPSYKVWDEYRKFFPALRSVVFRSKKRGWHNFTLALETDFGKYYRVAERDLFYQAFFDNILLNKPCFDCKLRSRYVSADIRLGDFWGKKYQTYEDGVSACLILSDKGEYLFQQLVDEERIKPLTRESIKECMAFQSHSDYNHWPVREYAFDCLKRGISLKQTVRKYRRMLPYSHRLKSRIKRWLSFVPVDLVRQMKIWYRRGI